MLYKTFQCGTHERLKTAETVVVLSSPYSLEPFLLKTTFLYFVVGIAVKFIGSRASVVRRLHDHRSEFFRAVAKAPSDLKYTPAAYRINANQCHLRRAASHSR